MWYRFYLICLRVKVRMAGWLYIEISIRPVGMEPSWGHYRRFILITGIWSVSIFPICAWQTREGDCYSRNGFYSTSRHLVPREWLQFKVQTFSTDASLRTLIPSHANVTKFIYPNQHPASPLCRELHATGDRRVCSENNAAALPHSPGRTKQKYIN